jgi:hypothetical protein
MKGTQILQVMFDNDRNIFFQGFMYLTYYSIIGNYDDIENHLHNNLSNYPYDSNGNLRIQTQFPLQLII